MPHPSMPIRRALFGIVLAGLIVVQPVSATRVQYFRHGSQPAFEGGQLDQLVATNFGELKLRRLRLD